MAVTLTQRTLPDGRIADVLSGGASSNRALVMHHGTPSDASLWTDWGEVAREHGLRLISISRPGYALSTRKPRRRIIDVAADVTAILDEFEIARFVTAGWSGGGPHALASAAAMPERCDAVATLAGVGPFGAPDLDWLAGMGPENVAEFTAAQADETTLRGWLRDNAEALRAVTGGQLADAFGGLVSDVDKAALTGGFAQRMADSIRRGLHSGFDGWVDDDFAFTQPWGFALDEFKLPITVWQGDQDLMVPFAHGRWLLANIPGAVGRMVPGHGHISPLVTYRAEIVADLAAHLAEG